MMVCKYCNAEIAEDMKFCPNCGKNQLEEELDEEMPVEVEQAEEKTKKKVWPVVLGIIGVILALAVLAVVLLWAFGVDLRPRANDIHKKDVYTVTVEKAEKKSNEIVATLADKKLTNAQLQIYYRMQVVEFVNYYGNYLSYLGFDYTKPLSEQTCTSDKSMTWEQYFLNIAIETWQNYQIMGMLAEEAGFTMTEEAKKVLEALPDDLKKEAETGKYESVDAMLEEAVGPGCTLEEYMKYVELTLLRNDYFASISEEMMPTDAESETYFTENEATFKESGITKDSGLISAVRHLLVMPEGGTENDAGETVYTDAEWAAALVKAEALLQEWKNGAATEESFAELANKNSDDGDGTTGGLYEGIYKGSGMVEEFEAWAIDATRKTGDTAIVKTMFGYHIMYFVSGEQNWLYNARTQLLAEKTTALIEENETKWPIDVNYGKIAVIEVL